MAIPELADDGLTAEVEGLLQRAYARGWEDGRDALSREQAGDPPDVPTGATRRARRTKAEG